MKQQSIRIFVDGSGADPNGDAALAWLRDGQKPYIEWGKGWTNNEAEYKAVLSAVKALPRGAEATILCDSELVIRQLRGEYQVLEPRMWDLHSEVEKVVFNSALRITWQWIPRSQNKADRLLRHKPREREKAS
jgi:ribonuclease HI